MALELGPERSPHTIQKQIGRLRTRHVPPAARRPLSPPVPILTSCPRLLFTFFYLFSTLPSRALRVVVYSSHTSSVSATRGAATATTRGSERPSRDKRCFYGINSAVVSRGRSGLAS
jgi:hypothetical protein